MFRNSFPFFRKKRKTNQTPKHSSIPDHPKETTEATSSEKQLVHNTSETAAQTICDKEFLKSQGYKLYEKDLGDGTFSTVKRAFSQSLKKDVAVKIINRDNAASDFLKRFLPRELDLIRNLKHPNICECYSIMDVVSKVYIVMEYAPMGDLLDYVLEHRCVKEDVSRKLFLQIVSGLKYLHWRDILHRDLKCENILLTENSRVLISDFGFAKHTEGRSLHTTYCGSSAYASLEILTGLPYDGRKSDIWSIGCILYIMVTGTMPFDDSNKIQQMSLMRKGPPFVGAKQPLSHQVKDLILKILNTDVNHRATIEDIENDEWCQPGGSVPLRSDEKASSVANMMGSSSSKYVKLD